MRTLIDVQSPKLLITWEADDVLLLAGESVGDTLQYLLTVTTLHLLTEKQYIL